MAVTILFIGLTHLAVVAVLSKLKFLFVNGRNSSADVLVLNNDDDL